MNQKFIVKSLSLSKWAICQLPFVFFFFIFVNFTHLNISLGSTNQHAKMTTNEILTPKILIETVKNYYPQILEAQAKQQISVGKNLKEQGVFDLNIEGKSFEAVEGYYQGDQGEVSLSQRMPWLKSSVALGYRRSHDLAPLYRDFQNYRRHGSPFVALELNLLRDNFIDKDRLSVQESKLQVEIADLDLELKILSTTFYSLKALYHWLITGASLKAYWELIEFQRKRLSIIERKVKAGALAPIYEEEAIGYLMQSENLLLAAQKEQADALSDLLPFLLPLGQDSPLVKNLVQNKSFNSYPYDQQLSELFQTLSLLSAPNLKPNAWLDLWPRDPYLKILNQQKEITLLEKDFSENQELPQLKLKISHEQNLEIQQKRVDESKIYLDVGIPLQRRQARGLQIQAQAKLNSLTQMTLDYQNTLISQWMKLQAKINQGEIMLKNGLRLIESSERLLKAENQRFLAGSSDFFLINLREQQLIKSKIDQLKIKKELLSDLTEVMFYNRSINLM